MRKSKRTMQNGLGRPILSETTPRADTLRRRRASRRFFTAAILLLFLVSSKNVEAFCFDEAGRMFAISPKLLEAIARHESRLDPEAINRNANGTYDYGLMQINSSWADHLGERIWKSLSNPCQNVKVGAWILSGCITQYGYNWTAVGCYNARSDQKRRKYERFIYRMLRSMVEMDSRSASR